MVKFSVALLTFVVTHATPAPHTMASMRQRQGVQASVAIPRRNNRLGETNFGALPTKRGAHSTHASSLLVRQMSQQESMWEPKATRLSAQHHGAFSSNTPLHINQPYSYQVPRTLPSHSLRPERRENSARPASLRTLVSTSLETAQTKPRRRFQASLGFKKLAFGSSQPNSALRKLWAYSTTASNVIVASRG